MRRRSKKYLLCIAIFVFITSYISSSFFFAYLRDVFVETDFIQYLSKLMFPNDISCYWENPDSTGNYYNFIENSIYFHQTSCDHALSIREACAIEAAAKLHQNKTIYFLFTSPIIPKRNILIKELVKFPNVKVARINVNTYFRKTPLENFFKNVTTREVSYKNVADVLKFITLLKLGGTVIDFDVILTKSLDGQGSNWLVKDSDLTTAILKLSNDVLGRAAADMVLSKLDDQGKNINGKTALTEAFKEICAVSNAENISSSNCHGYQIYDSKLMYPYEYSARYKYFASGSIQNDVPMYRIWDNQYRRLLGWDSRYVKIAKTYCPTLFNTFMYEFTGRF